MKQYLIVMEILVCFHHFLDKLRKSLCYQDGDDYDVDDDDEVSWRSHLVSFGQMAEVDHVSFVHHIHASVKKNET